MSETELPAPVLRILDEAVVLRVCTVRPDGWPHVAPFRYHWNGEKITVVCGASPTLTHVRAGSAVTLLVDLGSRFEDLRGALLHGTASVRGAAEAAGNFSQASEAAAHPAGAKPTVIEFHPVRAQWWDLAQPAGR